MSAPVQPIVPRPYFEQDGVSIYHGDCLDMLSGFAGTFDICVTDPPYGTKTNPRDTFMAGEFSNVMPLALPLIHQSLTNDGAFYCFTSWSMMSDWLLRYQQYFKLQNIIVWDKRRHSGCYSSQSWQFTWEGIIYGIKGKRPIIEYMPDVVRSEEKGKRIAMQKPVDVIETLFRASGAKRVVDPFMGSGSTLVAASRMGLEAVGFEINEEFCERAADRLRQGVLF